MSANVPDRRGGLGVASLLRTVFFCFFNTLFLSFFRFLLSSYLLSVLFFLKSLLLFSSPLHFTAVTLFNLRRFVTSAYVSSRPLTRFLLLTVFHCFRPFSLFDSFVQCERRRRARELAVS